jgi:hypothetical protein
MQAPVAVALIAGLAVFVTFKLIHDRRKDKQRTADLAAIAGQLGFAFSAPRDKTLIEPLGCFSLFRIGGSRHASKVLSGQVDDTEVTIFDYAYTESSGDSTDTTTQTVMLLRSPNVSWPTFALHPERLVDRLAKKLGYDDINFESHPEFSRLYHLKGPDEPAVRATFTDDVLSFYESIPGLDTEAHSDSMIFFRRGGLVAPEGMAHFYEEGWTAYALLRKLPASATES